MRTSSVGFFFLGEKQIIIKIAADTFFFWDAQMYYVTVYALYLESDSAAE